MSIYYRRVIILLMRLDGVKMKNEVTAISYIIISITLFLTVSAYRQGPDDPDISDPSNYTHQKITKEAEKAWQIIPTEIKNHLINNLNADPNDEVSFENLTQCKTYENANYDNGDDIITGSGEEDNARSTCNAIFGNHFWDPDTPNTLTSGNDDYDDGLGPFGSAYRKALDYWRINIIPAYLRGDINESYYYLGRVAHLLEDIAQPSHVLKDPHGGHFGGGDSVLEIYAGNNVNSLSGNGLTPYYYEKLINNFDWLTVQPTRVPDRLYAEFFKLFWYTAQKTQYWASDDENANYVYRELDGDQQNWQCSGTGSLNLWADEGYTTCGSFISSGLNSGNVAQEANAVVPHAMKATAGLYRLFWDAVAIDWPTFHHDNRRTGFTLIRGDMDKLKNVEELAFVIEGGVTQDLVSRISVADLDADPKGLQEVVVAASKTGSNEGRIYDVEYDNEDLTAEIKWVFETGEPIRAPPSLGNIDGESDRRKEVVFGKSTGYITALDISSSGSASQKWTFPVPEKFSPKFSANKRGEVGFTAIEDVNSDGKKEIVFTDLLITDPDWPGDVYVLQDNGGSATKLANYTIGNGGGVGAPSIADIDQDGKQEIVVSSLYGVFAFNFDNNVLSKMWNNSHGRLEGAPVIYDIDNDGKYEIIYATFTGSATGSGSTLCQKWSCFNRLYILDAETGNNEAGSPIDLEIASRVTPAIGDVDNDGDKEIVIIGRNPGSESTGSFTTGGKVDCYEISGGHCSGWPFNTPKAPFISPNIFDVDNDGDYEVIFPEYAASNLFILNGDATVKYNYTFSGELGSAPAIADLDNDGVGEIAVKRSGSPITIISTLTGFNQEPELNYIGNITAIAGTLVDINKSGDVSATDPDGDDLFFVYSSPFNQSGLWNSSIEDVINLTAVVEVSDGNLSDSQAVEILMLQPNAKLTNTFSDGTNIKSLSFTGTESKNATIRLPKDATVIFSRIRIEGKSP